MEFLSHPKRLLGGAVALSLLIIVGSYFAGRWVYRDLPTDQMASSQPSKINPIGRVRNFAQDRSALAARVEESGNGAITESVTHELEREQPEMAWNDEPQPEETAETGNSADREFPEVPEGFPSNLTPIWLQLPRYKKGDSYAHEMIYRVLIKLWNQGDHDFVNGIYSHDYEKVYPLYHDVLYVEWGESIIDGPDGPGTAKFRSIRSQLGTTVREFTLEDMILGNFESKYPHLKFVEYHDAGYDPETFLTENKGGN